MSYYDDIKNKFIDNDTYIKKEKELLNKIGEVINTTRRLEEFNADCFKNLINKIIVSKTNEKENNVIT